MPVTLIDWAKTQPPLPKLSLWQRFLCRLGIHSGHSHISRDALFAAFTRESDVMRDLPWKKSEDRAVFVYERNAALDHLLEHGTGAHKVIPRGD